MRLLKAFKLLLVGARHEGQPGHRIREGCEAEFVRALEVGKRPLDKYVSGARLEKLVAAGGFEEFIEETPASKRWGAKRVESDPAPEAE